MYFIGSQKQTSCPCFSCDGVNLIPSSWYSAVFWMKDENNADNTQFQLLLSSAYTKSRTFQFLTLPPQ